MGATVGLVPVLRNLGADPERLLTEVGADLTLFDDPENWVSFTDRGRWVAHCVERTGCHHLGLLVGQRNHLHMRRCSAGGSPAGPWAARPRTHAADESSH